MNTRKLTRHIDLHISEVVAYIVSNQVHSDEIGRLPLTVKTIVFQDDSVNPEVLRSIPLSVSNVCFTTHTLQHRLPHIPFHLEVFNFGNRVRTAPMPHIDKYDLNFFRADIRNPNKRRRDQDAPGTEPEKCIKIDPEIPESSNSMTF